MSVLFFYQINFAQEIYHRQLANLLNSPTSENSTDNSGTGSNIDVVYYRCDWTIDPGTSKNISGTVTTYFKTTAADPDNKTMAIGTLTLVGTPLDIKNINFTANKIATGNQINLSVAYNEPIEKVIQLKSSNGSDFNEAGLMTLKNSSGTVNDYQFNDGLPFSAATFYRAKIYTAGKEEYSSIVKIQQSDNKDLNVSPNPATGVMNISFNNSNREKITVRVINAEGKVVIESTTNNDFIHFDISNLPAGIYVAQVAKAGQVTDIHKFIISH